VVIFRTHDSMHDQRPDFTFVGSARQIGLEAKYETAPGSHRFVVPETTLGALASSVQRRTGAKALRWSAIRTRESAASSSASATRRRRRTTADVDVVISGEQQELDGVLDSPEYVLRRRRAGHSEGVDHAGPRRVRRGRHAGDGAMDQGLRAGSAGAAREGGESRSGRRRGGVSRPSAAARGARAARAAAQLLAAGGPGIVAGGVGLSSGEFVLWPFIASQVGLVLLWGAFVGVVTQFFLNMEVERYTLATGETAVAGFTRFWRHWGSSSPCSATSPICGLDGRSARRRSPPISSGAMPPSSRSSRCS
jgi:hypothetical protein